MRLLLAALLLIGAPNVDAQATDKAQKICRETTYNISGLLFKARRDRLDLNELLKDQLAGTHDTWYRGVVVHMFHAAIDAPTMTEREVATLGYAYCIERRPAGT